MSFGQNTPESSNSKKFWTNRHAVEDNYPTPTSPPIGLPENEVVPKTFTSKRKVKLDSIGSQNYIGAETQSSTSSTSSLTSPIPPLPKFGRPKPQLSLMKDNPDYDPSFAEPDEPQQQEQDEQSNFRPSSSFRSGVKSANTTPHSKSQTKSVFFNNFKKIPDFDPSYAEPDEPQEQDDQSNFRSSSSIHSGMQSNTIPILRKKNSENQIQQQLQQQQQENQNQMETSPKNNLPTSSPYFKNPHLYPLFQAQKNNSLPMNNSESSGSQVLKPGPISIVQLESKFADSAINSPSSSNPGPSLYNPSSMSRSGNSLKSKIPVQQNNYQMTQSTKAISSLSSLKKQIKLSEEEFQFIIKQFKEKSKGKSGLNKQEFTQLIEKVLKDRFNPLMLPAFYRIYEIFDSDGNGEIDFVELATGISVLLHGSKSNTVKLLYSLIDKNGDGEVQKEELLEFFLKFFSGQSKLNGYRLTKERWTVQREYLLRTFDAADLDKNGIIDFNEFLLSIADPDHPLGYVFMNLEHN